MLAECPNRPNQQDLTRAERITRLGIFFSREVKVETKFKLLTVPPQ